MGSHDIVAIVKVRLHIVCQYQYQLPCMRHGTTTSHLCQWNSRSSGLEWQHRSKMAQAAPYGIIVGKTIKGEYYANLFIHEIKENMLHLAKYKVLFYQFNTPLHTYIY